MVGSPTLSCQLFEGSWLVDAVAASLELGWLDPSGRLADGRRVLELCDPVRITQSDIRQLQLAVCRNVEHISLASDPSFQEMFIEETRFPE